MPELITPLIRTGFLQLEVTGSSTLPKHFDCVKLNATSGNIIFTLPTITHVFRNKPSILFIRTDVTANTVTFVGTNGNYKDENFQLGMDPQLESIRIFADGDTWRRDGYGLPEQKAYWNGLSTGIIKIGSDSDDPTTVISANNAIPIAAATRVLTTRVNFKVIGHNFSVGQQFNPTGNIPADYNGNFIVDVNIDDDNVEVILLTDPGGDAIFLGTVDDGTLNIDLPGTYRIVDRVNDLNEVPANNQFTKSRSRLFSWVAVSNLDHAAIAADGALLIVVDDTETVSVIPSPFGEIVMPVYSDTLPHFNDHIQLGNMVKANQAINVFRPDENSVNNNPYNLIRNIARAIGVVNTIDNPIIASPINGTIQVSNAFGSIFTGSQLGYVLTKGFNPNFLQNTPTSPTVIFTVNRVGTGIIVNISISLNVDFYESSPGVFTFKGISKASNNFLRASQTFNVELLGQDTYSGASPLITAFNAGEPFVTPVTARVVPKTAVVSIITGAIDFNPTSNEAIFNANIDQFR